MQLSEDQSLQRINEAEDLELIQQMSRHLSNPSTLSQAVGRIRAHLNRDFRNYASLPRGYAVTAMSVSKAIELGYINPEQDRRLVLTSGGVYEDLPEHQMLMPNQHSASLTT